MGSNLVCTLLLPTHYRQEGDLVICETDQAQMVYIPAGQFTMGMEEVFSSRPVHSVVMSGYLIDRLPVTNALFAKFIAAGGYDHQAYWSADGWKIKQEEGWTLPRYWYDRPWNLPDHPVIGISWFEAEAYCNWAGKQLPTEAQWEKAARGGIWLDGDESAKIENPLPDRKYPWGNDAPDAGGIWRAVCKNEPTYGSQSTAPVGMLPAGASPYGCLDLCGNVWEWCQDWYQNDYYKSCPHKDPLGAGQGSSKSLRGGSWCREGRQLYVAFRTKDEPMNGGWDLSGFRCAKAL